MTLKLAWTIAGSDSSGGAGVQNDLQTFQHLGVHGCSVLTAVTAQNNQMVSQIDYMTATTVKAQIKALDQAFPPAAIKIGMLGTPSIIKTVASYLAGYAGKVVLDPILKTTSANPVNNDADSYLAELKNLFKWVDLLTPNLPEAEKLLQRSLKSYEAIEQAAQEMLSMGVKSVLIKGGHFEESAFSQDYWTNGHDSFWLSHERVSSRNYRGTGCALASAVTACLVLGYEIKDALVIAKMYINRALRLSTLLPHHSAFLFHGPWPEEERDLPCLTRQPRSATIFPFQRCAQPLGLYPVVDQAQWLAKLLPLGVKTIQLRIKNLQGLSLENEIKQGIKLARQYEAQIFINDYWELALREGAYGVHLGQEDLLKANIKKIARSALRLGISTHCYYEVAHAHAYRPSYLACGPIYPTTSKQMSFAPQGIEQLKRWRRSLNYPLVAIGGINTARLPEILATGVDGIALISEITKAMGPEAVTQNLLRMVSQYATHAC